jgi:hypothetical protein
MPLRNVQYRDILRDFRDWSIVLTNNADKATAALCQIAQSGRCLDRSDARADLPIGDAATITD